MRKIAITGMGVVAPCGVGKGTFWNNLKGGRSFITPITRFEASRYPSRIAGQIEDLKSYSNISPRLLRKIDDFSHMSLIASDLALRDANLDLSNEDLSKIGIFFGNALGGWLYAETELRDLYTEGRDGVSPYLASAWFPAAPQGQVSIYYGIKGYSKTVVADRASSLMAIDYAAKIIRKAKIDIALAGGTEAPVTPYALLCCSTYGSLSVRNGNPGGAYRPFDINRDGFVIGEGAGILILEEMERASKRGTHIYAIITGYGTTCDGFDRIEPDPSGKGLARAIELALSEAGYSPCDIDYICGDGAATRWGDISETRAIKQVFSNCSKIPPISAPKSMFGNLLGASGSLDVITAVLAMENGLMPPTINYTDSDPECDLDYVPNKCRPRAIKKALVISRGRGGINAVLALEKRN